MAEAVRVRFAPSPTGLAHIGNVRTALFNWLFARHHGGKFILRVEDTDRERLVPGAADAVMDALEWLGLDWDEGPRVGGPHAPYFQSQRLDIYHRLAASLIDKGCAYRCYCTEERLEGMREEQQRLKSPTGYDRRCRYLTPEERRSLEAEGRSSVVRFAMPDSGVTRVRDAIRGNVEWQNELLDDFIILKSDGFPTYHLAVVADDHLMRISHVLRAEEWLPSAPRHLQLYQALDFAPPQFGHLPMILGPDRSKLSKRHGADPVLDYRDQGYLPEALLNFMALLGWSMDDKTEIVPREALVKGFTLERVSRSPAIFDRDKLLWMNGLYIRQLSVPELAARLRPFLEGGPPAGPGPVDPEYLCRIVPLIQQRTRVLSEAPGLTSYFFQDALDYETGKLVQWGMDRESALAALKVAREELAEAPAWENKGMEEALRAAAVRLGLTPRQFFGTLRMAVTGRDASPPLFETMKVLGRERVLARVDSAVARLETGTVKNERV